MNCARSGSPAIDGGRGLKHAEFDHDPSPAAGSPAIDGGRGLKQHVIV